jgi:hypothetical protein
MCAEAERDLGGTLVHPEAKSMIRDSPLNDIYRRISTPSAVSR